MLLYIVGGGQEESTNSVQVLDTVSNTLRRLPNLNTRLTPLDMFSHCGELFLVGWQPARNNFVMCLDRETGEGQGMVDRGGYLCSISGSSAVFQRIEIEIMLMLASSYWGISPAQHKSAPTRENHYLSIYIKLHSVSQ